MNDTLESPDLREAPRDACIGVFDSGVGGLSILRALRARLPDASIIYVGDVAHAPYGSRSADDVRERSLRVSEWLIGHGAAMIVVACNTATVLAIEVLRARWPAIVFVGVEPGIKPAAAMSRARRIAVMATAATAGSERLRYLIARHAQGTHVHVQACEGLAQAIERGALQGKALLDALAPHCDAVRDANVDVVVLGCTHYRFVETAIRELLGRQVTVVDTATAVADRGAALWKQAPRDPGAASALRVLSTGATDTMQALLSQCAGLMHARIEVLTIIPSLPG